LAYIEEHLTESISLEALAELVDLSACYFCRAFGQSLGMPPQRYQLSRRIERAKALLAKHAASVTEVGLTVGYNALAEASAVGGRGCGGNSHAQIVARDNGSAWRVSTPSAWKRIQNQNETSKERLSARGRLEFSIDVACHGLTGL
jgi:AraC-like DNA-binding protein